MDVIATQTPLSTQRDNRVATVGAGLSAIAVFPFMLFHIEQHHWLLLALDVLYLIGVVAILVSRNNPRHCRTMVRMGLVFGVALASVSAFLVDSSAVLWLFPVIMAAFLILDFTSAAAIACVSLGLGVVALLFQDQWLFAARFFTVIALSIGILWIQRQLRETDLRNLNELAHTDLVTELRNYRAFLDNQMQTIAQTVDFGGSAYMALIRIDQLAEMTQERGRATTEAVARCVARALEKRISRKCRLFSVGLGEFAILRDTGSLEELRVVIEHCRRAVESLHMDKVGMLSVSIGVADLLRGDDSIRWYARAEKALVRAQVAGGNQIVTSREKVRTTSVAKSDQVHLELIEDPRIEERSFDQAHTA